MVTVTRLQCRLHLLVVSKEHEATLAGSAPQGESREPRLVLPLHREAGPKKENAKAKLKLDGRPGGREEIQEEKPCQNKAGDT